MSSHSANHNSTSTNISESLHDPQCHTPSTHRSADKNSQPKKQIYDSFSSTIEVNPYISNFKLVKFKIFNTIDEHLTLRNIVEKIIYENQTFDDFKQNIFPVLRKVESVDNFFDVLFQQTKDFTE